MINEENFTASLSRNILTLIIFDEKYAQILISNIELKYFENIYQKTIAEKAIKYFHTYKIPAKEHIGDLLEPEMLKDHTNMYQNILISLHENSKTINAEYVLDRLEEFILTQNFKISLKVAYEEAQSGNISKAVSIMKDYSKQTISVFDPGTFYLKDIQKSLDFFEVLQDNKIYTGIPDLDKIQVVPAAKELYILVGRAGCGKSWFLIHLARAALMQRKKVLHITLELSESLLKARYSQALFSLISHKDNFQDQIPMFVTDQFGNLTGINFKNVMSYKSLQDEGIEGYLEQKMSKFYNPNIIIKEFPTGSLSVDALTRFLDNLESYYNFIPDIILLDYLDLMSMSVNNMRLELGQIAQALRGIAVQRNLAMVTVAQANRLGDDVGIITRTHLAEDFSKVRIADNLITYNQQDTEKKYGIGRLFIDKARNSKGEGSIIQIAQNYSLGQFCLNSCRGTSDYKNIFEASSGQPFQYNKKKDLV